MIPPHSGQRGANVAACPMGMVSLEDDQIIGLGILSNAWFHGTPLLSSAPLLKLTPWSTVLVVNRRLEDGEPTY